MLTSLLLLAGLLPTTGHTVVNTGRVVAAGQNALFQVDHRTIFIESQTRSVEIFDARDGSLLSLGLPVGLRVGHLSGIKSYELRVIGRFVAFSARESLAGIDLNGNGSLFDEVLHLHDLEQGVTVNTQLAMPTVPFSFGLSFWAGRAQHQGRWLTFIALESSAGDLNGDGDTLDWSTFIYDGDCSELVGLGVDARHIDTVDPDGVAFAAIQGLAQLVEEQARALREQDAELAGLRARLRRLEAGSR